MNQSALELAVKSGTKGKEVYDDISEVDLSGARLAFEGISLSTSHLVGQSYFEGLTREIADSLHIDYVFISELMADDERVALLSVQQNDNTLLPGQLVLQRSACQRVVENGSVAVAQSVLDQFPSDSHLKSLNAEAFVGVAIRSASNDTIGTIVAIHREPLAQPQMVKRVLEQLAPRVGAELERRQRELVIQHSEARLRLLTDRSHDALFYFQVLPRLDVLYVSPAVETIFGMPQEAFHANPEIIFEVLSEEDRMEFKRSFEAGEETIVVKIHRPDESIRWVEYRVFAVHDVDERLIGIGGNVRDITIRVEAQELARQSQQHLRSLLESIPDTLLLVRSDGELLEFIPGEVDLQFGDPAQAPGKNLKDLMSPAVVGIVDRVIRTAARSQRTKRVQFKVPGEREQLIDVNCLPFGTESLLLILRDMTAQDWYSTEDERKRRRDEVDEKVERRVQTNLYGLTYRELAVLNLVVEGMADKQIADTLGISIFTVNKHVGNILGKMNATSRTEAGVRAIREGLLATSE